MSENNSIPPLVVAVASSRPIDKLNPLDVVVIPKPPTKTTAAPLVTLAEVPESPVIVQPVYVPAEGSTQSEPL